MRERLSMPGAVKLLVEPMSRFEKVQSMPGHNRPRQTRHRCFGRVHEFNDLPTVAPRL